jgi:uncharacterized Zn finger protein (UPF0148 family)
MEIKKCDSCGSGFVYVLTDGTIVCRKCGARTNPKTKKEFIEEVIRK